MTLYPEKGTLATGTTAIAHRPDTMTSHFDDSAPSAGIQLSDVQSPIDDWQPIRTHLGTKWVPTIPSRYKRTCSSCPVYEECAIDVARGDFAWCEDVIPADFQLTNPKRTAYRNYQLSDP